MLKVSQDRGVMESQPNVLVGPKQRPGWASPLGDTQTAPGSQRQGWTCVPHDGHPQPSDGTACSWGDGTLSPQRLVSSASIATLFFTQITDKYIYPGAELWNVQLLT